MKKRDTFVFYRSYFEAIETLSRKNQLIAYEAIMRYSFNREMPENIPPRVMAILKMAIPHLDANYKKYLKRVKDEAQETEGSESKVEDASKVELPEKKF